MSVKTYLVFGDHIINTFNEYFHVDKKKVTPQ